jgi:ABC-type glutathione transport system ATPase component
MAPILTFRAVRKQYGRTGLWSRLTGTAAGVIALAGIDLTVTRGEVVGIVGESGSGKSTLAQIAVGLVAPSAGDVLLDGNPLVDLLKSPDKSWRQRIQMVFQDTGSALNPRKTVGRCLQETLALRGVARLNRPAEAIGVLRLVGLDEHHLSRLPHELSGGQRQRVGLARALAMKPDILVADEPVSSLDVSLQAQVVNLLRDLTRDLGLTLLFISHDLALVRTLCTRVVVMKDGSIVEEGPCLDVLDTPRHAYTRLLISAVPKGFAKRGLAVEPAPGARLAALASSEDHT